MASTGWTWEYIDENMTLPRLAAMNKHWSFTPPVHISLARLNSALLVEKKKEVTSDGKNKGLNDFIGDFMAAAGGGIAGL